MARFVLSETHHFRRFLGSPKNCPGDVPIRGSLWFPVFMRDADRPPIFLREAFFQRAIVIQGRQYQCDISTVQGVGL
jgi:hypothetical protein